jgi:hypothetical protein
LPQSAKIPPQPEWPPNDSNNPDASEEVWKDKYFAKHPAANANKDGNLTWAECKAWQLSHPRHEEGDGGH